MYRYIEHVHPSRLKHTYMIRDWLEILKNNWCDLREHRKEQYLMKINNFISKDMHWNNVYNMAYERDTGKLTFTGFPLDRHPIFKFNEAQIHWVLHRIGYNHAKMYFFNERSVKLELMFDDKREHTLIEAIPMTCKEYNVKMCDDEKRCEDESCTNLDPINDRIEHEHHHHKHCSKDERGVDILDI